MPRESAEGDAVGHMWFALWRGGAGASPYHRARHRGTNAVAGPGRMKHGARRHSPGVVSTLATVASGTALLALARVVFNELVRPWVFPHEMGSAWLAHNVEEVGMLEHILPPLYAARSS